MEKDVDSSELIIIHSGTDAKDIIFVIAKKGTFRDDVILQFTSRYDGVASQVTYYMTKSFGWQEIDRERKRIVSKTKKELMVWRIHLEKSGAIQ